jgi:hypothetical protein
VEEAGSSSIDISGMQSRMGRTPGSKEDDTGEYQPYVTAVLQRSTSVSSPVLGRPHSPMHASFTSAAARPGSQLAAVVQDPAALARLQEQLAQVQDPAAQQQLLQSYAVFVPPMLPIDVSGSHAVSPRYTQQDSGLQDDEEDLFDEDGMASESLLRQLTDPSNAFGGAVEYEDQFSGYLHAPGATADSEQQAAAAVSSMQQTVEQYRQQLQLLQQQSQRQSQRPL